MSEIEGLFDFLQTVYGLFGFTFKLKLSTRPEKYLGDLETWNFAEDQLKKAMTKFKGNDWTIDEGDGAFYGPKIDITIADALKREFQCATIQLDYQAPINFKLEYVSKEKAGEESAEQKDGEKKEGEKSNQPAPGRARPVVIHRAIIGSFERFLGILIEHFAGKWPFWISPRQIMIVPVMPALNDYALEVQDILRKDKLNVDVDVSGNTLAKKIRSAQVSFCQGIRFGWWTMHLPSSSTGQSVQLDLRGRTTGDGVPLGQHSQPRRPLHPKTGSDGATGRGSGKDSGFAQGAPVGDETVGSLLMQSSPHGEWIPCAGLVSPIVMTFTGLQLPPGHQTTSYEYKCRNIHDQ